jgi:hypothetical protein
VWENQAILSGTSAAKRMEIVSWVTNSVSNLVRRIPMEEGFYCVKFLDEPSLYGI